MEETLKLTVLRINHGMKDFQELGSTPLPVFQEHVAEWLGLQSKQVILMHLGKVLEDNKPIYNVALRNGSRLTVLVDEEAEVASVKIPEVPPRPQAPTKPWRIGFSYEEDPREASQRYGNEYGYGGMDFGMRGMGRGRGMDPFGMGGMGGLGGMMGEMMGGMMGGKGGLGGMMGGKGGLEGMMGEMMGSMMGGKGGLGGMMGKGGLEGMMGEMMGGKGGLGGMMGGFGGMMGPMGKGFAGAKPGAASSGAAKPGAPTSSFFSGAKPGFFNKPQSVSPASSFPASMEARFGSFRQAIQANPALFDTAYQELMTKPDIREAEEHQPGLIREFLMSQGAPDVQKSKEQEQAEIQHLIEMGADPENAKKIYFAAGKDLNAAADKLF